MREIGEKGIVGERGGTAGRAVIAYPTHMEAHHDNTGLRACQMVYNAPRDTGEMGLRTRGGVRADRPGRNGMTLGSVIEGTEREAEVEREGGTRIEVTGAGRKTEIASG